MLYRYRELILFVLLIGLGLFVSTPCEGNGDASSASVQLIPFDQGRYNEWIPTIDTKDNNHKISFLVVVKNARSFGNIVFSFDSFSNWEDRYMNDHVSGSTKQDLCIYTQEQRAYADVANARENNMLSTKLVKLPGGATRLGFVPSELRWETQSDGRTKARVSWVMDTYLPENFVLKLTITCEDYGAFGTLKATLAFA